MVLTASEIEQQLEDARNRLRKVDDSLNSLSGRPTLGSRLGEPFNRDRPGFVTKDESNSRHATFDGGANFGRVMVGNGGQRTFAPARITRDAPSLESNIRQRRSLNDRFAQVDEGAMGDDDMSGNYNKRRRTTATFDYGEMDARPTNAMKPTIPSAIVMPAIDTKSREEAIKQMGAGENDTQKARNRRLFSGLVVGTLNRFRKEKLLHEDEQQQKQIEVEKKIDEEKMHSKEKFLDEKRRLIDQRAEQAMVIKTLQRKHAFVQICNREVERLRLYGNFIQLQGHPNIFYSPAIHTLRTLELQKNTQKKFEEKIAARQAQLQTDLTNIDSRRQFNQQETAITDETGDKTTLQSRRRSNSRSPVDDDDDDEKNADEEEAEPDVDDLEDNGHAVDE